MKPLHTVLAGILSLTAVSSALAGPPDYSKVLNQVHSNMRSYLLQFNDSDAFVTATPISGFFLDATPGRSFFTHRETFFKLRFLGLNNTNDLIGFIAYNDNMRDDALKMLAHFSNAVQNQKSGSWFIEKEKLDKAAADKLLTPAFRQDFANACRERHKNAAPYDCDKELEERIKTFTEGNLYSVFLENYGLVNEIFAQDTYYRTLEMLGSYQYIQLVLLEVLANQNYIASMQQDFMDEKRAEQLKRLRKDLDAESLELQREAKLVNNRYIKSIDQVMKRRERLRDTYAAKADALRQENIRLANSLDQLHQEYPKSFEGLNNNDECSYFKAGKQHRRCKAQLKLKEEIQRFVAHGETEAHSAGRRYIDLPEQEFPKAWKEVLKENK